MIGGHRLSSCVGVPVFLYANSSQCSGTFNYDASNSVLDFTRLELMVFVGQGVVIYSTVKLMDNENYDHSYLFSERKTLWKRYVEHV